VNAKYARFRNGETVTSNLEDEESRSTINHKAAYVELALIAEGERVAVKLLAPSTQANRHHIVPP